MRIRGLPRIEQHKPDMKRERERERLTEDFRDIRGTACAGKVPQPRPSFSTPKLER